MQHTSNDQSPTTGLKFDGQPVEATQGDDYDALADLFLGDEPAMVTPPEAPLTQIAEAPPTSESAPRIEALVLGHLPVRGSAWTGQYAASVAQTTGKPTALIRLRADHATISLVDGGSRRTAPVEFASLESALASAGRLAPNWIVQTDELAESELAQTQKIDRITLLVGANEASIVATYRAIKGFTTTEGIEPPVLGIAVVGASLEEAQGVRDRIERASQVFLSQPIELVAAIEKVGPTGAVVVFDGSANSDLISVLEQLERGLRTPAAVAARPVETKPAPPRPTRSPDQPRPMSSGSPRVSAPLAAHLSGLNAIAARCPDDANTEIAIDATGRIHLLCDASVGYERLSATLAWAQSHAKLLALTSHDVPMVDPGLMPVGHLFTAEPKHVRHLMNANVRLHLRAQVQTGDGATAWFHTELN